MRGLLLMSITGAALYGLLMLTNHFLPQESQSLPSLQTIMQRARIAPYVPGGAAFLH